MIDLESRIAGMQFKPKLVPPGGSFLLIRPEAEIIPDCAKCKIDSEGQE